MTGLAGQTVLVTGAGGFLGRHLVRRLHAAGAGKILEPRQRDFDLTVERDVERLFAAGPVDLVIHAAACVGGIEFNRRNPGEIFYRNVLLNALVLEHARRAGVGKFVGIGSVCAYPEHTPVPFREEELWNGYPEPTNGPYGLSKRSMLAQGQAYRAQYGFNAVHLLMMNLYGPGDNFDPVSSHVIPALIRRFDAAERTGVSEVSVWGDGRATREFLFVDDAARGVLLAAERYDDGEPVNLGAGFEISVRDLALLIAELTGYRGGVSFDASKPAGQRRRMAEVSRAKREFGFEAEVGFREGLELTIAWYRERRAGAAS